MCEFACICMEVARQLTSEALQGNYAAGRATRAAAAAHWEGCFRYSRGQKHDGQDVCNNYLLSLWLNLISTSWWPPARKPFSLNRHSAHRRTNTFGCVPSFSRSHTDHQLQSILLLGMVQLFQYRLGHDTARRKSEQREEILKMLQWLEDKSVWALASSVLGWLTLQIQFSTRVLLLQSKSQARVGCVLEQYAVSRFHG